MEMGTFTELAWQHFLPILKPYFQHFTSGKDNEKLNTARVQHQHRLNCHLQLDVLVKTASSEGTSLLGPSGIGYQASRMH
ncbi:conserved hypothetical protein [Ricinus communis]|uniref:Uncharacterized protein n=1 Tax=Ricinus communis TaxID=3988 RepID=B9RB72_RICCO|nr:conserved hypothetical protein [Ricinus communis]